MFACSIAIALRPPIVSLRFSLTTALCVDQCFCGTSQQQLGFSSCNTHTISRIILTSTPMTFRSISGLVIVVLRTFKCFHSRCSNDAHRVRDPRLLLADRVRPRRDHTPEHLESVLCVCVPQLFLVRIEPVVMSFCSISFMAVHKFKLLWLCQRL